MISYQQITYYMKLIVFQKLDSIFVSSFLRLPYYVRAIYFWQLGDFNVFEAITGPGNRYAVVLKELCQKLGLV